MTLRHLRPTVLPGARARGAPAARNRDAAQRLAMEDGQSVKLSIHSDSALPADLSRLPLFPEQQAGGSTGRKSVGSLGLQAALLAYLRADT